MPSLQVIRFITKFNEIDNSQNTYHYFYEKIVDNGVNMSKQTLAWLFMRYMTTSIMSSISLFGIINLWDKCVFYNFKPFYLKYYLYVIATILKLIAQAIAVSGIILVFFNQTAQNSIKTVIIMSCVVNIVIFGVWYIYGGIEYFEFSKHYSPTAFCDLNLFSYCPKYFSLLFVYELTIYNPISMLFCVILNHITYKIKQKYVQHTTPISANDDNIELITNTENSQNNNSTIFCYGILFCICWFLFNLLSYLIYFANIKVEYYFYEWLTINIVFKSIFKHIGKNVDIITINFVQSDVYKRRMYHISRLRNKSNLTHATLDLMNNKFFYQTSMEFFVEFLITLMYYVNYFWFYFLEISAIDNSNAYASFIQMLTIHLCSEMCQSVVNMSKFYFTMMNKFSKYLDDCVNDSDDKKWKIRICQWFGKLIRDDSTFEEYQTRHAIDATLRFLAMIISFLVQFAIILVSKYGIEKLTQTSMYFFITAVLADVLYFIVLFTVYSNCFCKLNIWEPFVIIFDANWKSMIFFVSITTILKAEFLTH